MMNVADINRHEVGSGQFIDSRNKTHKVIHSAIFSEDEKEEHEERITEDLCRIFTFKRR
ncbi:hypothetical protein V6615_08685 [Oscillospiraceae bacterium PP1C4]